MASTKSILDGIKKVEESQRGEMKPASAKKLSGLFQQLSEAEGGPLAYVDITTAEDMKEIYGVEVEEEFEMMDEREMKLKGASNAEGYQWLTQDIELVVLGNTPRNKKISKQIVARILKALGNASR
ncbi:MAG: hypothetical protein KGH66_01655 [Candidatus Micrarchaeota archaeon]|nr:hypothetical protein [Candidatus Micrarchaeota archaeon]